ncbi:PhzF family phenazine biosynthesis protein [Actibacterium sp. 188UL27-1]|uniref:PhzF family phenazine biosynthesis protein n=1 Tax=Actibacterium sp. 188UL27-1 TaxID=2786961 RepID=UPI001959B29E|nr:PhzF family phenazine biosynthesis protein [Actibacterium sp. 188UL27-1]MBM7068079.1 PhzF family phenazine biosynthesis protein [Actibacterium sp. 188UL27-1]
MAVYPVDWVDAFTNRPFGGNGCAVVDDSGAMSDADCIAFTRETSLVECTFIGVADAKVRYVMATGEIPFAGHPTIASVGSLLHRGLIPGDTLTIESGAGVIDIRLDRSGGETWIEMTQIAPTFGPTLPAEEVAAAVGLTAGHIIGQPQVVSTGLPFCITVIRDQDALRRAALMPDLAAFAKRHAIPNVDEVFPYLVTLSGASEVGATFARLLLSPPLPPEDAFTGSATGATAAYLWHHGLIDSPSYIAEQGHAMGRPGQARVEVLGPPDAITGVKVAGQAHVLISGDLLV